MRILFNIFIALVSCQICLGQKSVQLAPALLKYSSVFFKDAAKVEMKFAQEGANIYYTLDGQLPTEKSTIYKKPIRINKNLTTLQVMTSGPSFLPSEIISTTFIKDGLPIQSEQHSTPNEKYQGNGPNTLFDNEGGLLNMKSPTWIGYQQDTIEILVELKSAKKVQSVLIDFLSSRLFIISPILFFSFSLVSTAALFPTTSNPTVVPGSLTSASSISQITMFAARVLCSP